MAKIDVSKISGFDEMSDADKLKAVLDLEIQQDGTETERLKNQLSKANSEAANYKRQLQEKMTAEEKERAEREETARQLQEELESLRKEKTISAYEKKYLEMGYDPDLAARTAKAMADGDTETVFANQSTFIAAEKKKISDAALNGGSNLRGGNPPSGKMSREDIYKRNERGKYVLSAEERQAAIAKLLEEQ